MYDGTIPNGMERYYQYPDSGLNTHEAMLILQRAATVAARCAIGDGLDRTSVALVLHDLANAIETQDCAEDMSKIVIPME